MRPPATDAALDRRYLARSSTTVAAWLLNKVIVATDDEGRAASGRIVEVEAYGGADDGASHAHRGRTARNASMFARAGTLYVYFTYGMHCCANVVTGVEGDGQAVLIRALEPLSGIESMRGLRDAARRDVDLCNGPAKLCQALGIDLSDDGSDLLDPRSHVRLVDDGVAPPRDPTRSRRIGISRAVEEPWRLTVPGDPHVSRPWPPGRT